MGTPDQEFAEQVFGTRLRADAYAKAVEVLSAADRLLRMDPAATLEEIAQAAGAGRTTVYRRFPTRADLLIALSRWALGRIVAALEAAQIAVLPAEDALFQATRNVIEVKIGLEYARTLAPADDPVVAGWQARARDLATQLITDCREAGLVDAHIDLDWTLTVFYALVHEASVSGTAGEEGVDVDETARRVVQTLLHGVGPTARTD